MFRRLLFFRVALRSGRGVTDGTARPCTQRTFEAAARGGNLPRSAVLLLAALLAAFLTIAPRAEAFIYWSGSSLGSPTGGISRADLDGSNVDPDFVSSQASNCGVASDGKHLYWPGGLFNSLIGRANLPDGTGVDATFIDTADPAVAVAVDSAHVYWANLDYSDDMINSNAIGRADLDGSNVDQSFISLPEGQGPIGLAVDGGHIYWTAGGATDIGRADLDGSNVDLNFIDPPNSFPYSLAVSATHIYFWHSSNGIGRANLNGTGVDENFIPNVYAPFPSGVAVDGAHVYWANPSGGYVGPSSFGPSIGRADLDGSNVDQSFISEDPRQPFSSPCGVAVDALSLDDFSFGKVKKNQGKGIAKLTVKVPDAGELDLAETKKVEADDKFAVAAGTAKLLVKPNGKAKKKLDKKGKATVKAMVTYTPDGGEPYAKSKKITLLER